MISAALVKELRERTGAGMMDCKRALTEANGDMDKAIEGLREKGLAAAAKRAGRIAAEGLVDTYISEDGLKGALVEVNCETDFVASNKDFIDFTKNIAKQVVLSQPNDVESLLNAKYMGGDSTVKETLTALIAKIGENMTIRRIAKFSVDEKGVLKDYIHGGGRIGVMVYLTCEKTEGLEELAKDIAMQVAAANPQYLTRDEVPADVLAREKEIYKTQAMSDGKPENIAEKMVAGKVEKFYKEVCLMEQLWIRDGDYTIKKLLDEKSKELGAAIAVKKFARFEKGEGIEKKSEDFASEVASQINRA